MNKQYNIKSIPQTLTHIPAKTRTVTTPPLEAKMKSMKVNESFMLEGAEMKSAAPNCYATARRLGIKVTLRQLDDGVGVWRVRNATPRTELEERKEETATPSRRGRPLGSKNKPKEAVQATTGRRTRQTQHQQVANA
ncbi:hypothetical protein Xoosp13_109 [Xanthomonas phage Xoo-sp13]|nr:hypothetical protein Xoosp13_109 [Xanthomonas phage Xoo-sp13]